MYHHEEVRTPRGKDGNEATTQCRRSLRYTKVIIHYCVINYNNFVFEQTAVITFIQNGVVGVDAYRHLVLDFSPGAQAVEQSAAGVLSVRNRSLKGLRLFVLQS